MVPIRNLLCKVFRPRVILSSPQHLGGCGSTPPCRLWSDSVNKADPSSPLASAPVAISPHRRLQELVSSGCYGDALNEWEKRKAIGQMDSDSYTVVMAMCERLGSREVASAVREDMRSQGLVMDAQCSLHYVNALIADGRSGEALSYLTESAALVGDSSSLARVVGSLLSHGHPQLALDVCHLTSDPCDALVCVWLECLGSLKRVGELMGLIEKVYGGVGVAPERVQLALVDSLCLADQYPQALDLLSHTSHKATGRAGDVSTAVEVFCQYWAEVSSLKESQLAADFLRTTLTSVETDRHSLLLSAGNTCLLLQALALRDAHNSHPHRSHSAHSDNDTKLRRFMEFDFYGFLRRHTIFPDSRTYEALLLRVCFDEEAVGVADRAIRSLFQAGSPLTSVSSVEWTRHCGPVSPDQASRVLSLIRSHFRGHYKIPLCVDDYCQLLGVELVCGSDPALYKKALDYFRNIKNIMHKQGLLSEVRPWNALIAAVARLDAGNGPLFITYDDMIAQGVEPDLDTYKAIVGAAASKRAARTAVFDWWRVFNSLVRPDSELMNGLMKCCLLGEEQERAFFFFGLFRDYKLQPNMETFLTLFKVCEVTRDEERLEALSALGQSVLPRQTEGVAAAVRSVRDAWADSERHTSTDSPNPSTLLCSLLSPL